MNPLRIVMVVFALIALACGAQPASPDAPARSAVDVGRPLAEGVTGQIRSSSGTPIAGASVLPRSLDASGPAIPEIAIESDEDGRYEWPLRPGAYELTFAAEGYGRTSQQVVVRQATVATVDVRLQPAR
jgi:hypothetical protein